MSLVLGIIVALGIMVLVAGVFSPRPEFPPLETEPDDPLLLDAYEKARASLPDFLKLARQPHEDALVKLRFVSSSGEVEHLWAEVLEVISGNEFDIRLMTPPVTHTGTLERRYTCNAGDIEDWHIRDNEGRVHGGFSQRAMFAIARRDNVKLPKKLLALEKEYID